MAAEGINMKLVSDQGEVLLEDSGQIPFLPRHRNEGEKDCDDGLLVHVINSQFASSNL